MSAIKQLLEGHNEFINPVLKALLDRGTAGAPVNDDDAAKKEAATLIAGILTGVKISIMQAAKLIEDMELDDVTGE